jgi:serine/threonine protein kinase
VAPPPESFEPEPQYRVLRKLAAGGIAEIFLAERVVAGHAPTRVALKRVKPHLQSDAAITGMLADEIELGLRCSHPNIVATLGSGQSRGQSYAVLEYVDGLDLARARAALLARSERFSCAQAVQICIELCKGLRHLHGLTDAAGAPLSVVHRDVTPPNVLLGKDGSVKLCDFGFVKSRSQRTLTEPGLIKGKFAYLSPEAALEQPVDLRADLYAVGIMLWEMLSMRRLFQAETDYETFKLAQKAEIPALPPVGAQEPEVLSAIVTRCLAREPAARYQTAEALHNALAAYADWQELGCDLGALVAQLKSPQAGADAPAQRGSASLEA